MRCRFSPRSVRTDDYCSKKSPVRALPKPQGCPARPSSCWNRRLRKAPRAACWHWPRSGARRDAGPAEFAFWRRISRGCLSDRAGAHAGFRGRAGDARSGDAAGIGIRFYAAHPGDARCGIRVAGALHRAVAEEMDVLARKEAPAAGGLRTWLGGDPIRRYIWVGPGDVPSRGEQTLSGKRFIRVHGHFHPPAFGKQEKPVHVPLARALQEYAGARNQTALRSLLEPVQKAAGQSAWTRDLLDSRRVFQPQAWAPAQAHAFLREVPVLEANGIITRIPNWWKNGRGLRPQVSVRVGEQHDGGLQRGDHVEFLCRSHTRRRGGISAAVLAFACMAGQEGLVLAPRAVGGNGPRQTSRKRSRTLEAGGSGHDGRWDIVPRRDEIVVRCAAPERPPKRRLAETADWSEVTGKCVCARLWRG